MITMIQDNLTLLFHLPVLLHVLWGVVALIAAVSVFVDVIGGDRKGLRRARRMSVLVAIMLWLALFSGGFSYLEIYPLDKPLVKAGPLPWAHGFAMELKEHLFFSLLMLGTLLPITLRMPNLEVDRSGRRLVGWIAALVILLTLKMEGLGALVALGIKLGILAR